MWMYVFAVNIVSGLDNQSKFQMVTLFSGRHIDVLQSFANMAAPYWEVNLCDTYWQISEVWENAPT